MLELRKKREMRYDINRLIQKYVELEHRVSKLEKGSRKTATRSCYWDKTQH